MSQNINANYKCICNPSTSGIEKNANLFSGNTNRPGFLITNPFILSTIIRTARYANAGKTVFSKKQVNQFGRWEGAPGGSGSPPKNSF